MGLVKLLPILKAAVEFAHEGKTRAVATLLERYPNELEEYKLCILSNFPESLSPEDYADLIPSTDDLLGPFSTAVVTKDWIHYEFIKESVSCKPVRAKECRRTYQRRERESACRPSATHGHL